MFIFFADDSSRKVTSLPDMGTLIGIGGVFVEAKQLKELSIKIDEICSSYGFPANEPFKWSPGRELWMRDNLKLDKRRDFFLEVIGTAEALKAGAIVVIEDTTRRKATVAVTSELDVTNLFFERVNWKLSKLGDEGILIVDRPGGGRSDEDRFLYQCLDTLRQGTGYVNMEHIILHACCPSKLTRLLQLSDVIISCSIAAASGEREYAPPVFEKIKCILCKESDRIGGVGFKMHPDFCYVNLYHWLLGDSHYSKSNSWVQLPLESRPYRENPYLE